MGLSRGSERAPDLVARVPPARTDPPCDNGFSVANERLPSPSRRGPAASHVHRRRRRAAPLPPGRRRARALGRPLRGGGPAGLLRPALSGPARAGPRSRRHRPRPAGVDRRVLHLRPVRPPAPVGPRGAAPRHRGLGGGDRPAGHGELLVQVVVLPGLGRSHLGAGPGAGAAAATAVAGLPVAPADGRPAGPADPGRRHLGRGQPARGDAPGRGLGVPSRSGTCGPPARPSPPTGCPSWAGSATSTASSGSMPPTACSSRPRGSPKPTWPRSRRWHARRRSRSGCWPTCRRCSPPGWRS